MGITCKPIGKLKGTLQKIENERIKEQHTMNLKKGKKSDKES